MLNRSSFLPRHQHGAQGGSALVTPGGVYQAVPLPFVPNYSGDGHGRGTGMMGGNGSGSPNANRRLNANERADTLTGNGRNVKTEDAQDAMPIWSGDGRREAVNPMMPIWEASSKRPPIESPGNAPSGVPAGHRPTSPPHSAPRGDGQASQPRPIELSGDLVMNVNVNSDESDKRLEASVKAARSETWKLVALVVVFLVWISTASTLLFLYMDRYLFP